MKEFTTQDMIDFVRWYDNKKEIECHRTFTEELKEWLSLREAKNLHKPDVSGSLPTDEEIYEQARKEILDITNGGIGISMRGIYRDYFERGAKYARNFKGNDR